mmetsp:Transcript_21714/g.33453  ORF Transcript_21714/g.33453 Transcript_21714/m.33453 type:complete len:237 (-) Transcript_21714:1485-2195(-)
MQDIKKKRIKKSVSSSSSWKMNQLYIKLIQKQKERFETNKELKKRASLFQFALEEEEKNLATLRKFAQIESNKYSKGSSSLEHGKELRVEDINNIQTKFRILQRKPVNDRVRGTVLRNINGVRCFVKYNVYQDSRSGELKCHVVVYSKIHSRPLEYTFDDIEDDLFNPKAAIRRLRIKFDHSKGNSSDGSQRNDAACQGEPYLVLYEEMDDVYVDTFSDTVFFMAPQHIVSYVYGS